MPVFVVDGTSLTSRSSSHGTNLGMLLKDDHFWFNKPTKIGPHELKQSGQLSREKLLELLEGFDIPRKNKKYFDNSSIGLFHCVAPLRERFSELTGEDISLYVNLGPANADLEEFSNWALENSPEEDTPFTAMMASSVVKILPNVVMSNLAMNADILGENTVSSGSAASSAWALKAACRVIEQGKAKVAIVAAASFPYQYFNIDAYLRFFGEKFFTPPLCEGSTAVALSQNVDSSQKILGAINKIHLFKADPSETQAKVLADNDIDIKAYDKVLLQPTGAGNFLAAAEPFGLLTVLHSLNEEKGNDSDSHSANDSDEHLTNGSNGHLVQDSDGLQKGLSVTVDYFGNYSVIEVSN